MSLILGESPRFVHLDKALRPRGFVVLRAPLNGQKLVGSKLVGRTWLLADEFSSRTMIDGCGREPFGPDGSCRGRDR